jgi:hypothetical protein
MKIKKIIDFRSQVLFPVSVSVFCVCFLLTLTLFTDTAVASEGWESNLNIKIANAENRLSFGQKADATNGIDGRYDVPSMSGEKLEAVFILNGKDLWRDIRSVRKEIKQWDIKVDSPLIGEEVVVSWNKEDFPEGINIRLIDPLEKKVIDMKRSNGYIYRNNGTRYLKIEIN